MTLTEALLVVVIIVIIFMLYRGNGRRGYVYRKYRHPQTGQTVVAAVPAGSAAAAAGTPVAAPVSASASGPSSAPSTTAAGPIMVSTAPTASTSGTTESAQFCRMGAQACPKPCAADARSSCPLMVNARGHITGCMCQQCRSYDAMSMDALNETREYFATCKGTDETSKVLDCVCAADDENTFAVYDYGAPGVDYNGFVASQAVDDNVISNHIQYVKDRQALGPGGMELTGRTYSPDSNDSYDPIPWIGLRRPEFVSMCNPTQVPDVDQQLFKGNRQFCFRT